jgi:hypothetical protein
LNKVVWLFLFCCVAEAYKMMWQPLGSDAFIVVARRVFFFVTMIRRHSRITFLIIQWYYIENRFIALIIAFEIYSYKQNVWNYSVNKFMNVVPCGCPLLSWWVLLHTAFEVVPFSVLHLCQQTHKPGSCPCLHFPKNPLNALVVTTFTFLAAVNLWSFSFVETETRSGVALECSSSALSAWIRY